MIAHIPGDGNSTLKALTLSLCVWAISVSTALAEGPVTQETPVCPKCHKAGQHRHFDLGFGKLRSGPAPGFQGFGLGFHPGHGYGGDGLGVGTDGGYPFYGGPGYPHSEPRLQRFKDIAPFPYYGGPGAATPACPVYFGPAGPLVADPQVIEIEREPGEPDQASDYGPFTGTLPYPETTFAPFTTTSATVGAPRGLTSDSPEAGRIVGIVAVPVVDPDRTRGLKVTTVNAGSTAEKAGLHAGDVIRSINGHVTEQPAHLAWVTANAAPDKVLKMSVRSANDAEIRTLIAHLP